MAEEIKLVMYNFVYPNFYTITLNTDSRVDIIREVAKHMHSKLIAIYKYDDTEDKYCLLKYDRDKALVPYRCFNTDQELLEYVEESVVNVADEYTINDINKLANLYYCLLELEENFDLPTDFLNYEIEEGWADARHAQALCDCYKQYKNNPKDFKECICDAYPEYCSS